MNFAELKGKVVNVAYDTHDKIIRGGRLEVIVEDLGVIGCNGPEDGRRVKTNHGSILTVYPKDRGMLQTVRITCLTCGGDLPPETPLAGYAFREDVLGYCPQCKVERVVKVQWGVF